MMPLGNSYYSVGMIVDALMFTVTAVLDVDLLRFTVFAQCLENDTS